MPFLGLIVTFSLALVNGKDLAKSEKCGPTIGGPDAGSDCIFPFIWGYRDLNTTYKECTADGGNEYWCSTKVDELGFHVSGKWGECAPGCPGVPANGSRIVYSHCPAADNQQCIFPFSIDGFSYRGCLEDGINEDGFCMVQHPTQPDKLKKAPCTAECPKDAWLTHRTVPTHEILHSLITNLEAYTTVKRDGLCKVQLNKLFNDREVSKMPKVTQEAKTWKEAFKTACRNSRLCKGSNAPACKARLVERRRNMLKAEDGGTFDSKADCKIQCGHP